jgi:predicted ArsR family transcriptional regulator
MTSLLMNRTRSRILHFLSETGPSTNKQIAAGIELSPGAVRRHLALLTKNGSVDASRGATAEKGATLYSANAATIEEQCKAASASLAFS